MLSCTRCRQAYYCSQECQAQDWRFHKKTVTLWLLRKLSLILSDIVVVCDSEHGTSRIRKEGGCCKSVGAEYNCIL
jgi:CCR4-NOT transcriptional regulation complex NOT5 subunit